MSPGFALAFFAGMLSFLSPCVLPLVPSYLGLLGGRAALLRALQFVAGFSLVFVALGASASALGSLLLPYQHVLGQVGGVFIVVFGLMMLGLRPAAMAREGRPLLAAAGNYGPLAVGVAFAFGWSPCIGPVLGAILTLAAASGSLGLGVGLLATYALGLALPFLLFALLWERLRLNRLNRYTRTLERVGGAMLVLFGVLLLTGEFTRLSAWLIDLTPAWLLERL